MHDRNTQPSESNIWDVPERMDLLVTVLGRSFGWIENNGKIDLGHHRRSNVLVLLFEPKEKDMLKADDDL